MNGRRAGVVEPSRRSYSLRQRLDVIAGGLLFVIVVSGCVAFGLIQQRQQDTRLLNALHEQERLVYELNAMAAVAITQPTRDPQASSALVRSFHDVVEQLTRNLQTFLTGGTLTRQGGTTLIVKPLRDRVVAQQLEGALTWIEQYRTRFDIAAPGDSAGAQTGSVWRQELTFYGQELHTFLRGIAAWVERRASFAVVRASHILLLLMAGGLMCFLLGVMFLRRFVTTPLHRMADGIEAMRKTGRLVKLPVIHANEMGVVASGFNQLAEEVEAQKRRMREHIVELQRVNAELDQMANLKDDFLSTINHQLRTPLTAIVEGVGLLSDGTMGTLTDDQRALVHSMGENATKLRQLVDQALDLSMLNSDRRPLKREPGDLVALLRETQASWQAVAQSRTIRLACGELPPVYMDVGAIHDVMDHLLRNALRHTPERSEVLVEVATQDGMAEVSVRDQGPGLSEEQLARLFQPFVHLQTPDAPGSQGSGLGLAFCRQLIERHRGTIRAESSERLGTRVIFTLPIASVRFLLEEAFRCAQEEAAREHSQFGLLLVTPARSGEGTQPIEAVVRRAEQILRRNTHRGDRFVRVDSSAFAIVAVTDGPGLQAMAMRLRHVLDQAQLSVTIGRACFPADGGTVDRLVEVARRGGLASAAVRATTRNSKEVAT